MANEDGLHDIYINALNSVLEDALDDMTPQKVLQHLARNGWSYRGEAEDGSAQEWSLNRGGIVRDWVTVPLWPEEDSQFRVRMRACLRGVLASEAERLAATLAMIIPPDLR